MRVWFIAEPAEIAGWARINNDDPSVVEPIKLSAA